MFFSDWMILDECLSDDGGWSEESDHCQSGCSKGNVAGNAKQIKKIESNQTTFMVLQNQIFLFENLQNTNSAAFALKDSQNQRTPQSMLSLFCFHVLPRK